jgi:hypothetical protein
VTRESALNPEFRRYFRFARVGLPTAVSFWLLVKLWRDGELYGKSGAIFGWFVAAGALQAFGTSTGWWAIVLVLKRQINRIY